MLLELSIENFAIIDALRLSFGSGMSVLSGETGAGKSIIVGAVNLLMGARASSDLIRSGSDEALVEGVFDVSACESAQVLLSACGLDGDAHQLIVRRIISRSGRNRVYIGERTASLQTLSRLGGLLLDVSGQYSQQLLLQPENHIDILDAFGNIVPARQAFAQRYQSCSQEVASLCDLIARAQDSTRQKDLLSFQIEELTSADLRHGEDEALEQEKQVLAHARRLYEQTWGTYVTLYESEQSCLGVLTRCGRSLADACTVDRTLQNLSERYDSLVLQLEDVAHVLRDYAEKLDMDPGRLEAIEDRLNVLHRLKKKYGGTVDELLQYKDRIAAERAALEQYGDEKAQRSGQLVRQAAALWDQAMDLTAQRRRAAGLLKELVERELSAIGMHNAVFETIVTSSDKPQLEDPLCVLTGLSPSGRDRVEFHIAPNPGEEPKPLSRIASGGEISRTVLALKCILASAYQVPTLLFDEVDAGIGGAVAVSVGEKLKSIAGTHQVLCITHLPQIACFADLHFSVSKEPRNDRTVTTVTRLDRQGRIDEIARMLSGRAVTDKTRAHAREMLQHAR